MVLGRSGREGFRMVVLVHNARNDTEIKQHLMMIVVFGYVVAGYLDVVRLYSLTAPTPIVSTLGRSSGIFFKSPSTSVD